MAKLRGGTPSARRAQLSFFAVVLGLLVLEGFLGLISLRAAHPIRIGLGVATIGILSGTVRMIAHEDSPL